MDADIRLGLVRNEKPPTSKVERAAKRTYNPKTSSWKSSGKSVTSSTPAMVNNSVPTGQSTSGEVSATAGASSDNLSASTADSTTATGSAEQEANTIEYYLLSGQCTYIATPKTIQLKAGDTVGMVGLGSGLSGSYYVQDVTRKVDGNGYSHTMTLIKTDFGRASIKKTAAEVQAEEQAKTQAGSDAAQVAVQSESRMHTLAQGETLWSVASKYYGDGSQYEKIAAANNIPQSMYNSLPVGLPLAIP